MDKFVVNGTSSLNGTLRISGSKNAALPIVFATLLCKGTHVLRNVPRLADMELALRMLLCFGARVDQQMDSQFGARWNVCSDNISDSEAPYDMVRKMRASFFSLGPLLARCGHARVSLPGGCAIGARPVDLHLNALLAMGAKIEQSGGYVDVHTPEGRLLGGKYRFPVVSVGATENILMAAVRSRGVCRIENAAREPEVRYLAEALMRMGAKIVGHGTDVIEVEGVESLTPLDFEIPPDRIEAATYAIGVHMCSGSVTFENFPYEDLAFVMECLRESGAIVKRLENNKVVISSDGHVKSFSIVTAPFPGFPTDVQAQWVALMSQADGTSSVKEDIFENRFMHVPELNRMGAKIEIRGNIATVHGEKGGLVGAPVMATDLRASASLVLAALVAKGTSEVRRVYHLDRGYESMELKLRALGANVERLQE